MMAQDILKLAHQHGVLIQVKDGQLFLEADSEPPIELINLLKQHKPDLLAHLSAGDAPMIEPLEHANDEPTPWERSKQRAMGAYEYQLKQATSNLLKNGYSVVNAKVLKSEWRTSIQRVMHLSYEQTDRLQRELIQDGLLAYDNAGTSLVRGNGQTSLRKYRDNPDFILDDDTGRTFTNWYYS